MKNILFKISKLVSLFFLLFFSFFLILTILVSFKPIKINNLKALDDVRILNDYKVKEFGNIFLSFNNYSRNYEIFIEDVRTNNSLIPNVLLGVRLKDILFLKFKPTILKLYDAKLELNIEKENNNQFIQADNLLNFFSKKINSIEFIEYLNDFQIFEVNNSKFKVKLFESEDYQFLRIDLKIEKKDNDFDISALIEQNEKLKSFVIFNAKKKNSKLVIDFSFENFNLNIPYNYLKKVNLAESKIKLNGKYSLEFDSNGKNFKNVSNLAFSSQISKKFKGKTQKLNFNKGKIDINLSRDFTTLNFDFFENSSKVKISYSFAYKDYRKRLLNINISEIKLEKFKIFWPKFYQSSVREWISENTSGDMNELILKVNYDTKGSVKDSSLKFNFSNTKIRYSDDKPFVKDLEGNASFDGKEFKFNIFSGVSDKLILNSASVKLYDFDKEIEMADIDLEITGNNYNLITYLEKISFNPESIQRISRFDGDPILKLNLNFPLLIDLNFDDIVYEGQLNYYGSKIPNFFENYDLEKVNIKINIKSDTFDYDGNANFQKMNINFFGVEYFNETQNLQNNLRINVDFDPFILNDYFPDFVKENQGFIPISIIYNYNLKNGNYEIIGKGPTDKLSAFFTFFSLNHNFFQGNLEFKLSGIKNINEKLEFKINTKDLNVFVESRKYNNELSEIILHSIKSPSQDFNATIRKKKSFWQADFSGLNLNLMKILENSNTFEDKSLSMKFNVTTKNLVLKKKKIIVNSFNGTLKDSKFDALNINFSTLKSKNNIIRIYNENKNKKLSIKSDDASEFLNVFEINPNLKHGTLSVDAEQDKDNNYIGNIKIKDFVAYDTPFFAKVLTLFSLDGIEQKLKDGGIFFNRLNSNYIFSKGDIKFSDGIIRGSDLGLTFKGDFNSKTDNFEINGTFIPAYTINTLLTSLPVVGDIITAGSPEDGILAASFELKKENEKFDINFNPVSVLVPSLIRNLIKNE